MFYLQSYFCDLKKDLCSLGAEGCCSAPAQAACWGTMHVLQGKDHPSLGLQSPLLTNIAAELIWLCSCCSWLMWPLGHLQAWPWGSCADAASAIVLGVDAVRSHQHFPGTCSGLATHTPAARSAVLLFVCQQAPACARDLDVTWRTACACALRARCGGYGTQPRLLHVPCSICMQNTLLSPSVLACSAFLHEQMCSFSCPLHVPCPT